MNHHTLYCPFHLIESYDVRVHFLTRCNILLNPVSKSFQTHVLRQHPHCKHIQLLNLDLELLDRKSTRLNSSHVRISYAVFCLKKKKKKKNKKKIKKNNYMA